MARVGGCVLGVAVGLLVPGPSRAAEEPVEVLEGTLQVPAGPDDQAAPAAIDDVADIFVHYEPVVPWFPGVNLELAKHIESPSVLEIPVTGHAMGFTVQEVAHISVHSQPLSCGTTPGRLVVLDFEDSTYN